MAHLLSLPQQPLEQHAAPAQAASRIYSLDFLRGLVMMVMVLDHTREFFHRDVLHFSPTDLEQSNPALFFTRFITHFCAPVFVFLAGTSIYLQASRGSTKKALSIFLLTRGLWLVVLEFTVVRWGIMFDLDFQQIMGGLLVIWAIGVSMIVMAALIHLPLRWVGGLGLLIIFGHNLLDGIQLKGWQGPGSEIPSLLAQLWFVLHQPFQLLLFWGEQGPVMFVLYPLLPWLGVMAAGYAFGEIYRYESARRVRVLWRMGAVAVLLFFMLRVPNLYGEPSPWQVQDQWYMSMASFFNVSKYPPSLLYLLITLGPALLLLARADRLQPSRWSRPIIVFGRVPLFFYLLQWPLMHGLALVMHLLFNKPTYQLFGEPGVANPHPAIGFDLWVVYVFWLLGIAILYPLCNWFALYKQQNREQWWLSYL